MMRVCVPILVKLRTFMYMYTANDLFNHSVKGAEQLEGPNFWKYGRERILEASNLTVGT